MNNGCPDLFLFCCPVCHKSSCVCGKQPGDTQMSDSICICILSSDLRTKLTYLGFLNIFIGIKWKFLRCLLVTDSASLFFWPRTGSTQ